MDTVLTLASIRELPDPAGDEALLALLPPERREKLLRLKRPEDRRRSFGAWFLLRAALKELGAEPGPLAYGPQGKPFFPDRPDLHFNLSHSGETVLCALSPSPVGCDAETISSAQPELAARFSIPRSGRSSPPSRRRRPPRASPASGRSRRAISRPRARACPVL